MEKKKMKKTKCLIIGSGPAGYTAAIYAARAGMKPMLFTGLQVGGQLTTTTEVENYPGYPKGVDGTQMMEDLRQQAERFGTEIHYEIIEKVDFSASAWKKAWSDRGTEITARTVIIATGAAAKYLGLPAEQRLLNRGVSACAVCDGFFFRNQDVVIVGGGDTACEEATYLAKLCRNVHMLVRRDEFRASKIMAQRVQNTANVTIHWNTEATDILGAEGVEGVVIKNNKTGATETLAVTGYFAAIGHKPNTDFVKNVLKMDETGYLVVKPGTSLTNIKGVFACGDAADKVYRQAVTAAGTGCMAALDAERFLVSKGW